VCGRLSIASCCFLELRWVCGQLRPRPFLASHCFLLLPGASVGVWPALRPRPGASVGVWLPSRPLLLLVASHCLPVLRWVCSGPCELSLCCFLSLRWVCGQPCALALRCFPLFPVASRFFGGDVAAPATSPSVASCYFTTSNARLGRIF